nr:TMV resistance protein N-like [Ipomoea batatas]
MLTSLRRLYLEGTNILNLPSNTSHLLKPPKSIPNLRRSFFQNNHLQLIQKFPPNLEVIMLSFCNNLEVVSATFPTCLAHITLCGCTDLKMLPELPHTLVQICLRDWKSLKMLPQLPQKLMSLEAINCESLETVHLPKKLKHVHFDNCIKLKEIQWENAQFLRNIKLRGVPNIKFSETINQVLKVSKLNYKIKFEGYLPRNETLSWIKFEENGSSISFQWPQLISKLELLGICIWVVLPRLERYPHDEYYGRIEKDGFKVWSRRWYSFLDAYSEAELLEEGGYDSFVDFIPQESFEDIKAGKIFKVIPKLINILGVFESFSKFKYVKKDDDEEEEEEGGFLQFLDDDDDEEEEDGFLQFLDDEEEEDGFLQFLDDEEEEEDGFLQFDEEEEDDF